MGSVLPKAEQFCGLLTLAERVPGSPIGDAIWKIIPTVPTLVHPAMCIGVDLGQLEGKQAQSNLKYSQLKWQCLHWKSISQEAMDSTF